MAKTRVSVRELVADRYRLLEIVHSEEGRTCRHGLDIEFERPVSLTESRLPAHLREETARRTTARILRESEVMALICPGRVATVVDVVEEDGALWTVTERAEGVPLGEHLARGPFNYVRAARIGLEILTVLEAAHGEDITHGDLSPGQVFVQGQAGVVVTGFGLAGATSQRVTAPSYAAPEQARGERAGPGSDLWSLGAILYAMVEGRPPFLNRGRPEATLRAVERLPLRTPLSAGPLAQVIQGLLRRNPRERLPEAVVREGLTRVLSEDPDEASRTAQLPRLRGACAAGWAWSRGSIGRSALVCGALAVVAASVTVLAATGRSTGNGSSASGAAPSVSVSTGPSPEVTSRSVPPDKTSGTTPSPSRTAAQDPPSGYYRYKAPEGFSVDLPDGWKRLVSRSLADNSYRVVLGATGDPRTLAVTYSTQLGPDPVAIWRELEPSLGSQSTGYQRVGDILSVDYQGHKAADMEWYSVSDGVRERTFGRGFLLGGHRGYSLRWTTPADDWNTSVNRQALDVFLRSFRESSV